jgi:hypothetical protein
VDTKEILMLTGTIVSVVFGVISIIFGVLSILGARASRKTAMGQAETSLRASIRVTRQAVRDLAIKIGEVIDGTAQSKLTSEQKRKLEALDKPFREAVEDNLNAYEDACAKYLDNKIDRERFKKMYVEEIRNLCVEKQGPVADLMHPEGTSKFQAIWKVYREWHVHEQ